MKVILDDGSDKDFTFRDEGRALNAKALFEDMFFMLVDHDSSVDD